MDQIIFGPLILNRQSQPRQPRLFSNRHAQDSCGVGMIASINGIAQRRILDFGLTSLANVEHRGAIGADGKTADGAGVLTDIPSAVLAKWLDEIRATRVQGCVGIGMFFLSRNDSQHRSELRAVQECLEDRELKWLGSRSVPVDSSRLGQLALDSLPAIEQVFVEAPSSWSELEFERTLFLLRKQLEQRFQNDSHFSITSFSNRVIVYKAMARSKALAEFYTDLQDPDYECSICIYHQRFSTNTQPSWSLCQPFRFLAHNGEINTVCGNRNWMNARQPLLEHEVWGDEITTIGQLLNPDDSDSCNLDNVVELLSLSGRSLSHSLSMLMPPAWQTDPRIDADQKAFYEYHASFCEPWDGPAAIAATDGRYAVACLDRNGLRPLRYKITDDDLLFVGSEVGAARMDDSTTIRKGRLGPGEMIELDMQSGKIQSTREIVNELAAANPYAKWLVEYRHSFQPWTSNADHEFIALDAENLKRHQIAAGVHQEEIDIGLMKMSESGAEPTFSMGVDTPLAVLSLKPRLLSDYFKQKFAQVTNPPIDPIRERAVMSLAAGIGPEQNLLAETPRHCRVMNLENAVLLPTEIDQILLQTDYASTRLDCTWEYSDHAAGLEAALDALCQATVNAVKNRAGVVVLSDRNIKPTRVAIPMLLAIGAVHHALCDSGQRMNCSIVAESARVRDPHQLALHFGYGCTAVYPYLSFATITQLQQQGKIDGLMKDAWANYREALNKGLMKIMSKSGISVLNSYQGAQIFEAIGIGPAVMHKCFRGSESPIGGVDFVDIAESCLERHRAAFFENSENLNLIDLGLTKPRRQGESHAINGHVTKSLHSFVRTSDEEKFSEFKKALQPDAPFALRHLLPFKAGSRQLDSIDQVESVETIRKRFTTAAMSLGAISPEAHEAIAIAMNRIGGKSNSGEGGEDPRRFQSDTHEFNANSKIKQVASGRFGVNARYLTSAEEIEIKMAQGAKPGEGGQLPGFKVNELIAKLRNTDPGVTLISPPPHHDIYSIEDLAQLIYDLKMVNPRARVCVKLVAKSGVGGIAIGVAKAGADVVLISGHEGGTGASPLTSIKHAGIPWEIGLAETHQALVESGFRDRVILRVDGGIRTGRDVMHAAILGADEYNFGTMALIALGCVYVKKCHLNNCPVGIATQDPKYRDKFKGEADNLVAYLDAVASECRDVLFELGMSSIDEVVGKTELLEFVVDENHRKASKLNLDAIVNMPWSNRGNWESKAFAEMKAWPAFDDALINELNFDELCETTHSFERAIENTDRNIGTRLSGTIARHFSEKILSPNRIQLNVTGTAGQSFGAFLVDGITLRLTGEANDYVGKGMSGGEICMRPRRVAKFNSHENVIAGNTILYGATGGKLFAAGRVAERFCVRNSGAVAVVEGCGDHGCEYMTRGCAVILGAVGNNFGAGMTGGQAFILDRAKTLERFCNLETIEIGEATPQDLIRLKQLVGEFAEKTLSTLAQQVLQNWTTVCKDFKRVSARSPSRTEPHSSEPVPASKPASNQADSATAGR